MCTAATYKTDCFYFGRNLDYERSWGESVTITPRDYKLRLRSGEVIDNHYAMIGMAHVRDNYPLYYDAANEAGLSIAGLNFTGSTVYRDPIPNRLNIAQFELIPWLLSKCKSVSEASKLLNKLNLTGEPFASDLPTSKLHWIIADKNDCIVLESTRDGLMLYENPVGVLTNEPPFPIQMFMLNNYMGVSAKPAENRSGLELSAYSRGMGGIGLPGDLSSMSRFVRAAFVRANSKSANTDAESVSQFFHILGSVEQQRGCCELQSGEHEYTIYTSCINADKGVYYYKTYDNCRIIAVDMHRVDLDSSELISYPLDTAARFEFAN